MWHDGARTGCRASESNVLRNDRNPGGNVPPTRMSTMKHKYSKEWYERRITMEGDAEIGAGCWPEILPGAVAKPRLTPVDTRIAFGTFVTLWRRNKRWDAAKLA